MIPSHIEILSNLRAVTYGLMKIGYPNALIRYEREQIELENERKRIVELKRRNNNQKRRLKFVKRLREEEHKTFREIAMILNRSQPRARCIYNMAVRMHNLEEEPEIAYI